MSLARLTPCNSQDPHDPYDGRIDGNDSTLHFLENYSSQRHDDDADVELVPPGMKFKSEVHWLE